MDSKELKELKEKVYESTKQKKYRHINVEQVFSLIDQFSKQELPVIPRFVADWIEKEKYNGNSFVDVIVYFDASDFPKRINDYINKNQDIIAKAWIFNDYTIENRKQ